MIRLSAVLLSGLMLAGCASQAPAPTVSRNPAAQAKAAAPLAAPAGGYVVKKGDTLYRIALENGLDYRDLAAWNGLADPGSIKEGQVLRVAPPGSETASGTVVSRPIATGSGVEARPLDQAGAGPASAGTGLRQEPKVNKEPYSDDAYARLGRGGDVAPRPAEAKPEPKPEAKPEPAPAPTPVAASPEDIAWIWPSAGKLIAPFSESGNRGLDFGGKTGDPVLAAGDGKVVYAGTGLRGYGQLVIVKHNGTFLSAYAHNQKILVKEGQQVGKGQKIAEMGNSDSDVVKLHFEIRRQGKPVDPLSYLPRK